MGVRLSMNRSSSSALSLDATAVCLSLACLVHCLALPLLVTALPIVGSLAENELVHRLLVLLALPVSLWALVRGRLDGTGIAIAGLILIGLSLLLTAAFVEALHDFETPITVAGALILSAGHLLRWRLH